MTITKTEKHYTPKKDEAYMSKEQLEYFTNIFLNWKNEIISEGEKTREYLKESKTNIADLNDRASQEEEFSLELRTRDRERKLLNKINEALARIEKNDFGYCQQCDEEIGLKRLEARPTAELCIDCKHLSELKEKGYLDSH